MHFDDNFSVAMDQIVGIVLQIEVLKKVNFSYKFQDS